MAVSSDPILDRATNPKPWSGLTVTYKARLENNSYKDQFNKTAYSLCRTLAKYCHIYDFYAEFTEEGRIHYHGIYKCQNKYKSLKLYEELRKNGFIKIEKLPIGKEWHEYIKKDYDQSRKLIGLSYRPINKEFYDNMLARDEIRRKNIEDFVEMNKQPETGIYYSHESITTASTSDETDTF